MNNRFTKYEKLGYRKVPGFNLMVHREHDTVIKYDKSPQGMVFEELNIMKGEYKSISLNGIGRHVHRLKGIAFIPLPKGQTLKSLTINHKDGDKMNNHVDNLEWVTYNENIVHAFENGMRTDNKPCVVRDIIEDKVIPCYSRSKAARAMGATVGIIDKIFQYGLKCVINYRYEIAETEEKLQRIHKDDIWLYLKVKPVSVYDMKTQKTTCFGTTKEFFTHINKVTPSHIKIDKGSPYIYLNRYVINLITDPEELAKLAKPPITTRRPDVRKKDNGKGNPVQVTYPNGRTEVFKDMYYAAEALNIKYGSLQKRMSKYYNGEWKGHKLTYLCSSKTS